jgi:hypothetical protein
MKFDCSRATRRSQSANRSVAAFCTFENLVGDILASLMSIVADGQKLTGPVERDLHVGQHSRAKAVREHDSRPLSDYQIISAKVETERRKRKTHRRTVTGDLVGVRVQPEMAKEIDDWRRKHDDLPGSSRWD